MSSTNYTSGFTPQDFTGTDSFHANGNYPHGGGVETGGWQLKRTAFGNTDFFAGQLLTYTYTNGAGVWSHPSLGTSFSNGRVGLIGDPNNPNGGTEEFSFLESDAFAVAASGPTVTSHSLTLHDANIPSSAEVLTADTVQGSDFTFIDANGSFTPSNFSLTAKSNGTGYNYDYNQTVTGSYRVTVDSKSVSNFYYSSSWTSSVTSASSSRTNNSNRILNVLATIPSNTTIGSGSDLNGNPNPLTTVFSYNSRVMQHTFSATIDGVTGNIYINFIINNKVINGVSEIVATFYETRTVGSDSSFQSNSVDYIIGAQETMTYTQSLLGDTTTYYVSDWIYSDEIEGDNYTPPVTTTSNGGGKPDRYPLIMTNLFNRNRSLYSIGMTHKDTWDLFL